MTRNTIPVLIIMVLVSCVCDPYADAIQTSRQALSNLIEDAPAVGIAVSVGIDGELVWSEGFGFADLEHGISVDPALTRFRVGSVSKPMTAAALGILHEEGRLDLDAPLQDYVPYFPEKRWTVTTRQVAGHLGGIRGYKGNEFLNTEHFNTVEAGLQMFMGDSLLHSPGTRYVYSSHGWNLLSAVVEGAAHEEFLTFMQARVFDPAGMGMTTADHVDSVITGRSGYYRYAKDRFLNESAVDNSYKWAGGGFLSTSEDLVRFGFAHLDTTLMSTGTIELLQTPQLNNAGKSTDYGIGWAISTDSAGRKRVGHGGGSIGGRTVFWIYPEYDMVLALIANMTRLDAGEAVFEIVNAFTGYEPQDQIVAETH